jgi:hypothetical protein
VGGKRHAIDFLVSTGGGQAAGQGGAGASQGGGAMDGGDEMAKRARHAAAPM